MGRVAIALLVLAAYVAAAPKLSPFTGVRFEADTPLVRFEGKWYRLVAIDSIEAKKIIAFCHERYRGRWEKRFAEDLVEVLEAMGKAPGPTVSLLLRDRDTGQERKVKSAAMTEKNRRAVYDERHNAPFGAQAAAADMKFLRDFLEGHHSYGRRTPGSFDRFTWTPERDVSKDAFALEIARRIAPFGDGHTRVRRRWRWLPTGYAPFLARVAGRRYVALDAAGRKLISPGYPYLVALDRVPIEKWIKATGAVVAHGSEAYRRSRGAEDLKFLAFLRSELKLPAREKVELTLESEDGLRTLRVQLDPARSLGRPLGIAGRDTGRLDGNIGYLRLREMTRDRAALERIGNRMDDFQGTRGLVIDVRGNGGGTRDLLRLLLPRLLQKPRVVNVAVYRLPPGEKEDRQGQLADRFLHPRDWTGWDDAHRGAITRFARGFKPEWEPPPEWFTAWHYMIVDPAPAGKRYGGRVVVLMDGDCFSATDIFLGAFKGVDRVTLMGTASGGGSGRSTRITLPRSGVRMRVSTMASFQPNGKLYDGNGIRPDVVVERTASDCLGKTDTQLEAALELLRQRPN